MSTWLALALLGGVATLLGGCATAGTAEGAIVEPTGRQEFVVFAWDAGVDPVQGDIQTTLPDGSHYAGTYFQITQTVSETGLSPMWIGWDPYWGTGSYTSYTTFYSGRVVANLQDALGNRMRCSFILAEPEAGLAGGGVGECTLADGRRIEDVVLGEPRR